MDILKIFIIALFILLSALAFRGVRGWRLQRQDLKILGEYRSRQEASSPAKAGKVYSFEAYKKERARLSHGIIKRPNSVDSANLGIEREGGMQDETVD